MIILEKFVHFKFLKPTPIVPNGEIEKITRAVCMVCSTSAVIYVFK